MSRVNYREAVRRFTHIDADFVASEVGMPDNDGFFAVNLYPWWEHPLYLEARAVGASWGFVGGDDAKRRVTVYPQGVYQARLSRTDDVIDWDFTQEHPLLWQYERMGKITCNSPVLLDQWMQMSDMVRESLTGYNRGMELTEYISPHTIHKWGRTGSFSLVDLPRTLFRAVRKVLDAQGIRYFAASEPQPTEVPVLFLIDGGDHIIAKDFEVDIPDFEHKPEWFQAR